MGARLEDWSSKTGVALSEVDVVLGVHTGGAMLAPLVARRLGVGPPCYIRVSRYDEDVIGFWPVLKVALVELVGRHHAAYRVSDTPDPDLLRGKTVLVVDDASASGGTFEAAHRFCVGAGAARVKGVALKVLHLWDPDAPGRQLPAKKLRVPCFTPWGTF